MFDGIQDLLNDKEHMTKQANAGNTAAMRIVSSLYWKEGNLDQAIEWAQKAISAEDSEALGLAALLHYERLINRTKLMPASAGGVYEDSDAFITILPLYMISIKTGKVKNDEQFTNQLMKCAQYAYYCYSFMLYCGDKGKPIDINKALEMIKDVPGTQAKLLYGAVLAEKGNLREAMPILEEGLRDNNYRNADKDFMENMIYQTAIIYASTIARQNGNLEKAVMILESSIPGIKDSDMRQDLHTELSKYQKRMFGGWKYNG